MANNTNKPRRPELRQPGAEVPKCQSHKDEPTSGKLSRSVGTTQFSEDLANVGFV